MKEVVVEDEPEEEKKEVVRVAKGEWQWRLQKGNVGAPSEARLKMCKLAKLNVFTPEVKKAQAPNYRFFL